MAKCRNKWIGLALAVAIALSALLPSFVANPSVAHAGAKLSSIFGEQLLICTGDGFKWVKLTDLQSGKEKPKPHSDAKCPLCYAARHSLSLAAQPVSFQHYGRDLAPVSISYNHLLTSPHLASALRVRAPPVSFIG